MLLNPEEKLPFELIKRDIVVKREADTSPKWGKRPSERSADELVKHGIVIIDKPKGPSSHQVSAYVQQILDISKSGHSGTLDPKVTGVLPVALEKATRIVQTLITAGKEYIALMHLHDEVEEYELRKVMSEFVGAIKQLPPIKSSVKRQERLRKIYYIRILEIKGQEVLFKVGCQAGTYIRKLCHDIGQRLGCGAHMAELRRTQAGPFKESEAWTLQDLADAYYYWQVLDDDTFIKKVVLPIEEGVRHLPKVWVLDSTVDSICHGANLGIPGISKFHSGIRKNDMVAVMTLKDELVCLGRANMTSKDMLGNKGIAVITEKVFMPAGTYPRVERF
ncbi:RNA-guided pseudouridylation complex pseudouridine synthase subunit Cbf5 [Candidatus Woesearchaeota archaeon]|nr:MAG: RNA-guided pseudouridylation complex pseudouridine synthase subunit Cbf5 [Candidatus Woesearchaeota archaeon]